MSLLLLRARTLSIVGDGLYWRNGADRALSPEECGDRSNRLSLSRRPAGDQEQPSLVSLYYQGVVQRYSRVAGDIEGDGRGWAKDGGGGDLLTAA